MRTSAGIIGICLLAWAVGCASDDKHRFVSTEMLPVTVELVDQRDQRPLWSMRVPVQYALEVDLDRKHDSEGFTSSPWGPDKMKWRLLGPRSDERVAGSAVKLSGVPVELHVAYRAVPEDAPIELDVEQYVSTSLPKAE